MLVAIALDLNGFTPEETTGVNNRKALHSISLKNREYSKDCLGDTVDQKGWVVVFGYYVTSINGKPLASFFPRYPSA